jgi:hypothetical protein
MQMNVTERIVCGTTLLLQYLVLYCTRFGVFSFKHKTFVILYTSQRKLELHRKLR